MASDGPGAASPPPPTSLYPAGPPPDAETTTEPQGYLVDELNNIQIPITATTIVGSDPTQDPEAASGIAAMITLDDPAVSSVQLRITIDGSTTSVEDVAGGTSWIQAPGGPMSPMTGGPKALEHGHILRLGSRTFVFHLPGRGSLS